MIEEVARVFLFLALGETLARLGGLPVPGPVIGLVLLYANLTWLGGVPESLGQVADGVLKAFGLLFVPAGVGVIAYLHLLQTDFLAIIGALIGGTIVTIAAVALLADRLDHPKQHEVLADAE